MPGLQHHVILDQRDSRVDPVPGGDKKIRRIDHILIQVITVLTGKRIEGGYLFYLVSKKDDAQGEVGISRENIYSITPDPECAVAEFQFIACIQAVNKPAKQQRAADLRPPDHMNGIGTEIIRIANAVDAGDRRDHNDITPAGEK